MLYMYRAIHLTEPASTCCVSAIAAAGADILVRDRLDHGRLLDKPIEQLAAGARSSPIETEGEFVQVVVQMRRLNGPLMCPQQPALQQRSHPVRQRQEVVADFRRFADDPSAVSLGLQSYVTVPVVCPHNTARLHAGLNRRGQTVCRGVRNALQPNAAHSGLGFLHCNNYQGLAGCAPTSFARPRAPDICLIHLHRSGQSVASRPHHCSSQPVKPRPGCLVAPQPQHTLKSQGTHPLFLVRNIPDRPKPQPKRFSAVMKDRPRPHRRLKVPMSALIDAPACDPCFIVSAPRAPKPSGPAQPKKILLTSLFSGEPLLKVHNRVRVVFHATTYYRWAQVQSSG